MNDFFIWEDEGIQGISRHSIRCFKIYHEDSDGDSSKDYLENCFRDLCKDRFLVIYGTSNEMWIPVKEFSRFLDWIKRG